MGHYEENKSTIIGIEKEKKLKSKTQKIVSTKS